MTPREEAYEMMNEVFRRIGKQYGYENVNADFVAFKQYKVQWERSYNWISFRISDYMVDAPENVMEDLAKSIFEKISGHEGQYSSAMRDWVLSPEFSQVKSKTFIKRGRYLTEDGAGEHKNLSDSVNRLVIAGLIPADHNLNLVWNNDHRADLASTYSVLMRTVMVHCALDDWHVNDTTLDYVIYNQYLHIKEGSRTFGTDEVGDIEADLMKFPYCKHSELELDRMQLAL